MSNVKLISVTPDAEKTIAYIARVSSPNQENPEIARLISYCITHGHWSILEHGHMTVEISTSRMITPQILRHWSARFQEFSQRYAEVQEYVQYAARRQDVKNRQNSIDDLPEDIKLEWLRRQEAHWVRSMSHYKWALDKGIAKECARAVLPLQTATKIYMTADIRTWAHYISLRSNEATQLEHRVIADEIKAVFIEQFPVISEALGWLNEE
jgi:thymidylate synthase (FAD)